MTQPISFIAKWFSNNVKVAWDRVLPTTGRIILIVIRPLHSTIEPKGKICAMCTNKLAQSYQGHM